MIENDIIREDVRFVLAKQLLIGLVVHYKHKDDKYGLAETALQLSEIMYYKGIEKGWVLVRDED